jgi:phosphoglycolate phosphatase
MKILLLHFNFGGLMIYSTVIFDLDGTLLDTSEGIINCVSYTIDYLDLPSLTIEQKKSFIGPPLLHSYMRECGLTEQQARDAVEVYRDRYEKKGVYQAKLYENIKPLLARLKRQNIKTGVATLKRHDLAIQILEHFDLKKYLDAIKGIDDKDSLSKADILNSCMKDLEITDFTKAVLIGDSKHDEIGADEIGIDFIAVRYGFGFQDDEDLENLRTVFKAMDVNQLTNFFFKEYV